MIGKPRGDVPRRPDNTRGNTVTDGDSDAEPYSENLQELASFFARMRARNGGGGCFRACGQWEVSSGTRRVGGHDT